VDQKAVKGGLAFGDPLPIRLYTASEQRCAERPSRSTWRYYRNLWIRRSAS
jgi:hypothetical protein